MCKPLTILEEKGNNTREQTAKDGQKVDFFLLWDESYFENSYVNKLNISLHSAGGSGNPCYGVQACLVNFTLYLKKC